MAGIDDIPIGPEMFEKWAGPKWGLRIWRVFFGLIVIAVVGGVFFGGWKATREVWQAYYDTPRDLTQAPEITSLKHALASVLEEKEFKIPEGFSQAGSLVRFVRGPAAVMNTVDPKTHPDVEFQDELIMGDKTVRALLAGRTFTVPSGYPYAGEIAAVVPLSQTNIDKRPGPGVDLEDVKKVEGSNLRCEGHPTCLKGKHIGTVKVDNVSTTTSTTSKSPPQIYNSGSGNAFSFGQQGGITAGTVNLGKPERVLTDTLKSELVHNIPADKLVKVGAVAGDNEAWKYATAIWEFLKNNGRNVDPTIIQYMAPGMKPLDIQYNGGNDAAPVQISVGPHA